MKIACAYFWLFSIIILKSFNSFAMEPAEKKEVKNNSLLAESEGSNFFDSLPSELAEELSTYLNQPSDLVNIASAAHNPGFRKALEKFLIPKLKSALAKKIDTLEDEEEKRKCLEARDLIDNLFTQVINSGSPERLETVLPILGQEYAEEIPYVATRQTSLQTWGFIEKVIDKLITVLQRNSKVTFHEDLQVTGFKSDLFLTPLKWLLAIKNSFALSGNAQENVLNILMQGTLGYLTLCLTHHIKQNQKE